MTVHVAQDSAIHSDSDTGSQHARIAIVGAGFSGLGIAIRLKQRGIDDFVILERAADVGGTWRDNTYPGCACDVPSHLYSFSFAPNPTWTHTFSPQQEILDYLRWCAGRFGLAPHICWNTELLDATWNEDARQWRLMTARGTFTAEILILGNGPLSEPAIPAIPGLDRFTGTLFHSARWNHSHDLTGEQVAVIGTGASAIQFVPRIQPQVGQLLLFQRTPPWVLPRLDRPISKRQRALFRALPIVQRLARDRIYWQREMLVLAFTSRPQLMQRAEQIALRHLEAHIDDPGLRSRLIPSYRMGCKRILLSDDFYPALNQANVEVVTERIQEVRAASVVTAEGVEREVDTIILATGFHVTDMPAAHYVHGRGGQTLADAWRDGPQAYLGTTIAGFPNLFLMIGPNTGLGHTSMVFMIESQIAYILDCLRRMNRRRLQTVEVRPEAQATFTEEVQHRMRGTVWTSGCASWYLDAKGHNTTLWPGYTWQYRRRTRRFNLADYALTSQQRSPRSVVSR